MTVNPLWVALLGLDAVLLGLYVSLWLGYRRLLRAARELQPRPSSSSLSAAGSASSNGGRCRRPVGTRGRLKVPSDTRSTVASLMGNERVKQLRAELDTVDEALHFAIRRGETETAQECIEAAHILEQAIAEAESLSLTGDGQARPAADPTPWGGPGSDPIADVADAARRDRERGI